MRLEKLRQVDLNLLIIFAVIAEGKSVTKGALAALEVIKVEAHKISRPMNVTAMRTDPRRYG